MQTALREIATQPAYRLRTRRIREPALAEQGVSDLTLEEACLDPTVAIRSHGRIAFREHIRETADPHFNLTENRILSGFLHFLGVQIADLDARLAQDVALREERKLYRGHATGDQGKSWWEEEDLPRIQEMNKLRDKLHAMRRELARLMSYPFLPRGVELREVPQSTPLIRSNRAYSSAYRTVWNHFQSYRVRLDGEHLLARGKSLPVLYEWWCNLEVLRILQGCLDLCDDQPQGAARPSGGWMANGRGSWSSLRRTRRSTSRTARAG